MSRLKNIFSSKNKPTISYSAFWEWFKKNEKGFHNTVKAESNIEKGFFDKLSSKLAELKDGYYYLAGMLDDNTIELILTADGDTKNIVFVEELIEQSPKLEGWKFTALKPSLNIEDVSICMAELEFNAGNISFYSNELPQYPDEIDITIIHHDLTGSNKQQVTNGVHIFLDNYLGELDFLNNIDNLEVAAPGEAKKELIPVDKLKGFLAWRQKEFVEKYDGAWYDTESDEYSILEAKLQNGNMLIAVVNTQLLNWDRKASHPWIAALTIKYDGSKNNGMPGNNDYKTLQAIEDEIMQQLIPKDGYLNIGRQTANGEREVYFACKDFRKPSKVYFDIQKHYSDKFEIDYSIYKDKYWQSLERFNGN